MHHSDYCSRGRRVTQSTLLAAVLTLFSAISTHLHAAGGSTEIPPLDKKPTMQSIGDYERGKEKSAPCAACHGADGNSATSAFPKLAGQSAKYIFKQLKDMKLDPSDPNARPVPQMASFLADMDEQTMKDLATYYAGQTTTLEGIDPELKALGETVYRAGNKETDVPACIACHGAQGKGMSEAGFPALSGQYAAYTEAQLKAFRAAGREDLDAPAYRANDGAGKMMRNAAKGLSDKEIRAVSNYVSGLH